MKTVLGILVVVVIAAFPAVAQSPSTGKTTKAGSDAKNKTPDYYPLKVGTKWQYQIDLGGGRQVERTCQISRIDQVEGKDLARLEVYASGRKLSYSEHLESTEGGVFRVRMNDVEFSPPICLIKYPPRSGQTWEAETTAGGRRMKVSNTTGRAEDIQVPAGKYRAIPCTLVVSDQTDRYTNVYWFVEGVGVVKQESETGEQTVTLQLVKYEPGK
jgi:hypothetical protein